MNDVESSASFISALAGFSQRLAEAGNAIYSVDYDFLHFGSWTIECGTRHHRSLLQWDGGEFLISLSRCDVADSRAQREWKLVTEGPVADHSTHDQLFGAAAKLMLETARS